LDVIRRFARGWQNFERVYGVLADVSTVYDSSGRQPRLAQKMGTKNKRTAKTTPKAVAKVGRALRRAAKDARRTARMHGVPIYVWDNGKVLALTD
jgi:hypothetical protein